MSLSDAPDAGRCLSIYQEDSTRTQVEPEHLQEVLRGMRLWAESAHTRDTVLDLTMRSGAECHMLASSINTIIYSTQAQRAAGHIADKLAEDEYEYLRREAGFIESE